MVQARTIRSSFVFFTALAMVACSASIKSDTMSQDQDGDEPEPNDEPLPSVSEGLGRLNVDGIAACKKNFNPGDSLSRRLTRREYNNTVADLLFDETAPGRAFPSDERRLNFDNNAAFLTVSPVLTEEYQKSAATLAANAVKTNLARLLTCDPSKGDDRACAQTFIGQFGTKAYRRPLTSKEEGGLLAVFDQGRKTDFPNGIRLVIEALLQSAPFLYRTEGGDSQSGKTFKSVTPWELASRLSFFLWATTPDDELLKLARSGELSKSDVVKAQVDRMLASPRAAKMVGDFHEQWLGLGDVVAVSKDSKLFPQWKSNTTTLLKEELRQFTTRVALEGGNFEQLMTSKESFVNADLARLYGFEGGPRGESFEAFTAPGDHRAGILTLGAILAATSKPDATSPVLRGVFVREHLLCQHLPSPPQDVDTTLPDVGPNVTTRERFAQHSTDKACSGCHKLIDPLGLGLEGFDAVGRHRTTEGGKPLDTSGEITASDVDGRFDGAAELASRLAKSQEVQRCMVTNWFRYALGRTETDADACFLHELDARFKRSNGNVKDVIRGVTESAAFSFRNVEVSQ